MKSRHGINFLERVVKIKEKSEGLVRELNTFLTEPQGINFKHHVWLRVEKIIKELAEEIS